MIDVCESEGVEPVIKEVSRVIDVVRAKDYGLVVGIGGGGGNSLSRMKEIGIKGGELIAVNTDAQDLLYSGADQKVLIGKELTQGLGAGSNPKIGRDAAKENGVNVSKKTGTFMHALFSGPVSSALLLNSGGEIDY